MTNEGKYKKQGVTPDKIVAYIESRTGGSQAKVAQQMGVSQSTVSRWSGEILDFVKQSDAYKAVPDRLIGMLPTALGVYETHLALNDLNAARDVLKMCAIFIERNARQTEEIPPANEDIWKQVEELLESGINRQGNAPALEADAGVKTPQDPGADTGVHPDGAAEQ